MLRMYFVQHWFNLADEACEEALLDSTALRRFVGIDLPGASACPTAPRAVEVSLQAGGQRRKGEKLFAAVGEVLRSPEG